MRTENEQKDAPSVPKPPWIRVRIPSGENFLRIRGLVREKGLHTVCAEALCPNMGECWGKGTATFLILGDTCTRNCRFCGVKSGIPSAINPQEAREVAEAISIMKLRHAVITSVTRDDLPDGGAAHFARTIRAIQEIVTECSVEVLVPDFQGDPLSISTVLDSGPEVFGHNMETVRRLYPEVRAQADYFRSLKVLRTAKELRPSTLVKTGIMVGLGETRDEVTQTMGDLREAGCDILTIGQYLSPGRSHFPVIRYYAPDEFGELRELGQHLGFKWVESGPLVRSSYHAEAQALQSRSAGSPIHPG
ncbi:MAG: lipoyl synthase [Syntrophobacteraceae bacterium]